MHTPETFTELLLLLLIALGAAAAFTRFKLPAVLGYLVVGVATGPSALGLVHDLETIRQLAELGVVLLLFTIGLEFSLPVLARMRGALLGLGGAEVAIAAGATIAMALWLDIDLPGAIVLGGVVAMSSTALVTKQLADQLAEVAWQGLILALALAFVARPLVVALSLWPFRYGARETAFVSWVGLRGAVPILLATYPVLAGVEGGEHLFHLVFFVVVVNALIPGATIRWVARRLGMEDDRIPRPQPVLEIASTESIPAQIMSFRLEPAAMVTGQPAGKLPLPPDADVLLIVRDRRIIPVREDTVLQAHDHVHLLLDPRDKRAVELLFGLREDD